MEETRKAEEAEINSGENAESIASLRAEVMHTGALNVDAVRAAENNACALDLDALSAGLEDDDSADNTTSISAIHDDGSDEESADGASDDSAEEISAEPEAQASDVTAPVAPKPKKRKKRRLRKWARVTLGAMGAIALMGGGYAIAMSANGPLSASTAAAVDSAPAESAQALMDTDGSAVGASADASAAPTDSAVPIASEIDAESTESAEITAADTAKLPLGNRGRLYIGDWSVQLNGDDNNDAEVLQTAADEPDSASYAEYNGKVMISDHANQGFSCIKALQVGDDITMKNADGEETTLEVVAAYPDAYYKDGYAMLPNGTDAWTTTDGDYILQTNGDDNGDTLYIVTCKVAEDAEASPEASASASAEAE